LPNTLVIMPAGGQKVVRGFACPSDNLNPDDRSMLTTKPDGSNFFILFYKGTSQS